MTAAVNVSVSPFEGIAVAAVTLVDVAYITPPPPPPPPDPPPPVPLPDPPPQLVTPNVNATMAAMKSANDFRRRRGATNATTKAKEIPPNPISHGLRGGMLRARTGTRTSWVQTRGQTGRSLSAPKNTSLRCQASADLQKESDHCLTRCPFIPYAPHNKFPKFADHLPHSEHNGSMIDAQTTIAPVFPPSLGTRFRAPNSLFGYSLSFIFTVSLLRRATRLEINSIKKFDMFRQIFST